MAFRFINPRIELLEKEVDDLKDLTEALQGANQVLQEQLAIAQAEKQELLDRLFKFSGIDKSDPKPVEAPPRPLMRSSQPWKEAQRVLELERRREYWNTKKKQDEIAQLEQEVLQSVESESDASKVS